MVARKTTKAPVKAPAKAATAKKAPAKVVDVNLRTEYPRAYEAGRRAKASAIPENQAPVMSDEERKAYLEGYNA